MMASPQLENGFTQIANELMDAFCRAFPGGADAQILLAIIRKTYGWKKKEDVVSISQLEELTGLSRRAVIYSLQNLEAKKMVTIARLRGRGNVNLPNSVSLQKNYDLWVVQRKSSQWEKQLQNKRVKYQGGVVQRKQLPSAEKTIDTPQIDTKKPPKIEGGSAENSKGVVQRIDEKCHFSAPTKERNIYIPLCIPPGEPPLSEEFKGKYSEPVLYLARQMWAFPKCQELEAKQASWFETHLEGFITQVKEQAPFLKLSPEEVLKRILTGLPSFVEYYQAPKNQAKFKLPFMRLTNWFFVSKYSPLNKEAK